MPALASRLIAIGVLAVAFVALTIAISSGTLTGFDRGVAQAMHDAWQPSLHPLFQLIAELGGIELTTLLMLGLSWYLWRGGFGRDAFVFVAFLAATAFELFYKFNLVHLAPPRSLAEADGPSLSELLTGSGVGNSFPSGHVLRAVIVYGLIAFVVWRLSSSSTARRIALIGSIIVVLLISFDRLYLDVHWASDVAGGLILGLIGVLAGTVWLDRPRPAPQN